MRAFSTILAVLAVVSGALATGKSVIVSFPPDTAASVIDAAKADFKAAGGEITHEYNLIKAFAGTVPEASTESINTLEQKYNATVEEDQVVSTNDGGGSV